MSDTQNKWVPVSERLPEPTVHKQILLSDGSQAVAFIGGCSGKWTVPCVGEVVGVTHWMDLPEPPPPPKPVDPFEAWWNHSQFNLNERYNSCRTTVFHASQEGWNAAKEHYARPLPDFETWWNRQKKYAPNGDWRVAKDGYAVRNTCARTIWNAAQGKPEA